MPNINLSRLAGRSPDIVGCSDWFCSDSVPPVPWTTMKISDSYDSQHIRFDLEDHPVRKSIDQTSSSLFGYRHPSSWVLNDASNCSVHFFRERYSEAELTLFIIVNNLVEFSIGVRMKVELHQRCFLRSFANTFSPGMSSTSP